MTLDDYPDYGAAFARLRRRIATLEAGLKAIRANTEVYGHPAASFAHQILTLTQKEINPCPAADRSND